MAHTLAVVVVARGSADAVWIASATLDRYLQSTGKPQVYGTQFVFDSSRSPTQEPYNRQLISDELRRELDVPRLAAQLEQFKSFLEQSRPAGTAK